MTPVALGTDLIEVGRVRRIMDRHGDRFLSRCFTPAERVDSERSGRDRAAERYAARFAAKEAASKALGTGIARGIVWCDLEVRLDEAGAPSLMLHGEAERRAASRGIASWLCSISHTAGFAMATVIGVS